MAVFEEAQIKLVPVGLLTVPALTLVLVHHVDCWMPVWVQCTAVWVRRSCQMLTRRRVTVGHRVWSADGRVDHGTEMLTEWVYMVEF